MAGHTVAWRSRASIAMPTAAPCPLIGCAAGSAAQGGARKYQHIVAAATDDWAERSNVYIGKS